MNQKSFFLNPKSLALILIISLIIAPEIKSMNSDSDTVRVLCKEIVGAGSGAAAGALIAGPGGAAAGFLLGTTGGGITGFFHELKRMNNEEKLYEVAKAKRKVRKKQAEAIKGAEIYINAQRQEWGKPVYDGKPIEAAKAPFSNDTRAKYNKMILFSEHVAAIEVIIKKLENDKQVASLLDYLQQCAILSAIPGGNSEGFTDTARKAIATYIHATIYAHRLPLEESLSETDANLKNYTKWFREGVTERENIQKKLDVSNRTVSTLATECVNSRAEKEKALADLQQAQASLNLETQSAELTAQLVEHLQSSLDVEKQRRQRSEETLAASVAQTLEQVQQLADAQESLTQEREQHQKAFQENAELRRRAESPVRRMQQKDARIAELEALLQSTQQPPQPMHERPAARELAVIHVPAAAAPQERPLMSRLQNWLQEKFQ